MSAKELLIKLGITDSEVAKYAAKYEFGDRTFIRNTLDANANKIADYITERLRDLMDKKLTNSAYMEAIGDFIVDILKKAVEEKGLVDTGRLRDSIKVVN